VIWLLLFFGALATTGAAILVQVGLGIATRTVRNRVDQWAIRRRARNLALFTVQDTTWLAEQRIHPFRTLATKGRAARGTADA
jgi:hypothetical protein